MGRRNIALVADTALSTNQTKTKIQETRSQRPLPHLMFFQVNPSKMVTMDSDRLYYFFSEAVAWI